MSSVPAKAGATCHCHDVCHARPWMDVGRRTMHDEDATWHHRARGEQQRFQHGLVWRHHRCVEGEESGVRGGPSWRVSSPAARACVTLKVFCFTVFESRGVSSRELAESFPTVPLGPPNSQRRSVRGSPLGLLTTQTLASAGARSRCALTDSESVTHK